MYWYCCLASFRESKACANLFDHMILFFLFLFLGLLRHIYWGNAFPLYGHGYNSVLEAIEKMEKNLPGFFYAGSSLNVLLVKTNVRYMNSAPCLLVTTTFVQHLVNQL